jgi:hypothetical protein
MPIQILNNVGDTQIVMASPNTPLSSSLTQPQNTYYLPFKLAAVPHGSVQPVFVSIPACSEYSTTVSSGSQAVGGVTGC